MTRRAAATVVAVVALVLDWLSDLLDVTPLDQAGMAWSEVSTVALCIWLIVLVVG